MPESILAHVVPSNFTAFPDASTVTQKLVLLQEMAFKTLLPSFTVAGAFHVVPVHLIWFPPSSTA